MRRLAPAVARSAKAGLPLVLRKLHLAPQWALLCAALITTSSAAQGQRFTLAIARTDGLLVPFAAYDAGKWEKAWPEVDEAIDAKLPGDVPSVWRRRGERVPDLWRVSSLFGGPVIDARMSGVEPGYAHCQAQIALKTNLPRTHFDPHVSDVKFGVAVDSASVRIGMIAAVSPYDSLWSAAVRAVRTAFSNLESAAAAKDRRPLPLETPAPAVHIEALYREAGTTRSPLYFVAKKNYRPNVDCGVVSVMTGWLVPSGAAAYTLVDPKITVGDCDMKNATLGHPWASIHVSSRVFWILQEHDYEDEQYVIADVGPAEVRYPVRFNAGGC